MSLTMYDDVTLSLIPKDAPAVASYVNGRYANHTLALKMFPKAKHLSIAVTSHADADCLDIETGDARPEDGPAWVKRQFDRGVYRPVVYANRSTMPAVIKALRAAGIKRSQVRLWCADYTFKPHFNTLWWGIVPTLSDATQWTDRALGRSLDQSLCSDGFFGSAPKPTPKPAPKKSGRNIFTFWRNPTGKKTPFGGKWWRA